jgi:hypothetical protein
MLLKDGTNLLVGDTLMMFYCHQDLAALDGVAIIAGLIVRISGFREGSGYGTRGTTDDSTCDCATGNRTERCCEPARSDEGTYAGDESGCETKQCTDTGSGQEPLTGSFSGVATMRAGRSAIAVTGYERQVSIGDAQITQIGYGSLGLSLIVENGCYT